MAVRERTAWISFVTMAVAFGAYFLLVFGPARVGGTGQVGLLAMCVAAVVVLQIALHIAAAVASALAGDREPAGPADERERLIDLRATRIGFYAMTTAALLAIFTIHLGAGTVLLANAMFAAVVVGELVRSGCIILGYRRG